MKKVLVVDDNIDSLEIIKVILSEKGFEVETISQWQQTFEKVNSFKPDLILLDVSLEGVDGRLMGKILKSNQDTRHIQIILLSGDQSVVNSYADYMADGFMSKPVDIDHLIRMVEKHMGQPDIKESATQ